MATSLQRIGFIGDVHAEDRLLDLAIQFLIAEGVDTILCSGDIMDGLGSAQAAIDLLRLHNVETVKGNHERWFLADVMRELPLISPADSIDPEARAFLRALPPLRTHQTRAGTMLQCHGLGDNDMALVKPDDEGYALSSNDDLQQLILDPRFVGVLNGHSHRPMARHFPGLLVINAGTLARDDNPGFLLIDFDKGWVQRYRLLDQTRLNAVDPNHALVEPAEFWWLPTRP